MDLSNSVWNRKWRSFHLAVLWFSGLSLWPVWQFRFPSMQDYPQHLFISYLLSTFNDPSFDWKRHYIVTPKAQPYEAFYYTTKFFALFCDIETSGKLFISLYIILVAALVVKASRSLDTLQRPPWGLLLLFPFSFSQIYFLGFTNYLISIPLLFLALFDLDRFVSCPLSIWSVSRHLLYQLLLFVTHPFTALLYLVFASVRIFFNMSDRRIFKKALFAPTVLGLLFLLWYGSSYSPTVLSPTAEWGIRWWPVEGTLGFFMLMFTGMHWTDGAYWPAALIWLTIAGLFVSSGTARSKDIVIPWEMLSFWILSLIGFACLPFWLTYYSYVNLRITSVSYFLLSIVVSRIPLGRKAAAIFFSLVTVLMVFSWNLQDKLYHETAEIMPLLAKMERNSTVLPLMLDPSAKALDPVFFYEFHKHETNYYNIVVGGGATPTLFSSPLLPVQYKPGVIMPIATDFKPASLLYYSNFYRYLLVRGAPAPYIRDLAYYYKFVGQSGGWSLFESMSVDHSA
jgi:hypothetical protein